MWRRCLVLLTAFAAACSNDPVSEQAEQEQKPRTCSLTQINLTSTRIAVSALHGPIRLSTLTGSPERVLLTGDVNAQQWSPAGNRLVFVDERPGGEYALSVMDTIGNAQQLPVPLRSTWPAWSKDDWIYFFTQNNDPPRIYRIRPDGSNMSGVLATGRFPAPAPDGRHFAYRTDDGRIMIQDLQSGTISQVAITHFAINLRWSPTADQIAFIEDGDVVLLRLDGFSKRLVGAQAAGSISWSGDGCFILSGSQVTNLAVLSPDENASLLLGVSGLYTAWKP